MRGASCDVPLIFLIHLMTSPLMHNDIDNHRSTYDGGYRIQRNNAILAWQHANQVTQQGNSTARKNGNR